MKKKILRGKGGVLKDKRESMKPKICILKKLEYAFSSFDVGGSSNLKHLKK